MSVAMLAADERADWLLNMGFGGRERLICTIGRGGCPGSRVWLVGKRIRHGTSSGLDIMVISGLSNVRHSKGRGAGSIDRRVDI